jgi:hypothetical protein
VEPDTDPQVTTEIFCRLQFTDHLQVTPALQVTHNPSFNDVKDTLFVGSVLRMRLAFYRSIDSTGPCSIGAGKRQVVELAPQ